MRKAGIKNYKAFALEVLNKIKNKPISFEIFADNLDEMQNQAEKYQNGVRTFMSRYL